MYNENLDLTQLSAAAWMVGQGSNFSTSGERLELVADLVRARLGEIIGGVGVMMPIRRGAISMLGKSEFEGDGEEQGEQQPEVFVLSQEDIERGKSIAFEVLQSQFPSVF